MRLGRGKTGREEANGKPAGSGRGDRTALRAPASEARIRKMVYMVYYELQREGAGGDAHKRRSGEPQASGQTSSECRRHGPCPPILREG